MNAQGETNKDAVNISLRPAQLRDEQSVRTLMRVGGMGLALDWQDAMVAVTDADVPIGYLRVQRTDKGPHVAPVAVFPYWQGKGVGRLLMEDALERAFAFVKAGADGIMIHSRKKDPAEILEFCDKFRAVDAKTPIVVVPTSFNVITEEELSAHGVNIVIYANQLTRSAFPAMQQTAEDILKYHRAKEVDDRLMSIKNIITLIDEI